MNLFEFQYIYFDSFLHLSNRLSRSDAHIGFVGSTLLSKEFLVDFAAADSLSSNHHVNHLQPSVAVRSI